MSECNPTDIDLQNEVAEAGGLPNQFKSRRYNTLDREKKQIRLLLFLAGEFKDPICCNLIAHLDENPYYKALSYLWGDPTNFCQWPGTLHYYQSIQSTSTPPRRN